jgi:BirA family biotin operon repressor/biotin-[acetyl-CoA-carboxylase] ligase
MVHEIKPERLDTVSLHRAGGIFYYETLDSTNSTAAQLAAAGAADGTVVVAEEQRRGRGRLGRGWDSAYARGLYFSLLWRADQRNPAGTAPITLAAAVSTAAVLDAKTGLPVKIKWPNDLLLKGKKLGGILAELKEGEKGGCLVIGIGLNINQETADFPPELQDKACSLFTAGGRRYDRTALLLALVKRLREDCRRFFASGFRPFREKWLNLSDTLGKNVKLTTGGKTICGKALDLDEQGTLLIETEGDGAITRINSGEIII